MKFSVLLSVYNRESPIYFSMALKSIWDDQLLKPNEIVLVKDGELTNELEKIIEQFSYNLPLKVITLKENLGLSAALNIGLLNCTYDIVARMDTDDICFPNRFSEQIKYLRTNPHIDIVGSYALKINELGEKKDLLKVPVSDIIIKKYIWTCPLIHPTVIFRKDKIIKVGGYDKAAGPRQDDYDLWFRCALGKLTFANIQEPLLYYRFFSDSVNKNDIKVGYARFKVGFKRCRQLKASPIAYVGITFPFIRSFLPYPLNIYFNKIMSFFNPRNR